ncbi:alpha/beta hydrolase [Shewanella surugensis]|uniref:Alpha/beta fold hydrolase n=1 Tax=Shewanella surugensis TaxID=212020 RepID=A0ABT0LK75_9GAMM|nr:alpha/beta fold hydrolase [Shewanella surugensis]MCL1127536.1 alpha/beta fold hydrolase [Shewanella surugensis]
MNKLIVISILIPIIFFTVVLSLVLVPVKRETSALGLDFNVLNTEAMGNIHSIEAEYVTRDGKALFYRYLVGDTDQVFVLLHGSGAEGRYLLPLADKLNKQLGATVIIPDLRGHGRSMLSKPGDIDYMGQYEDDLADLHFMLAKQYPDAELILVGHSSGGGLTVKYAGHAQNNAVRHHDISTDILLDVDASVLKGAVLEENGLTEMTQNRQTPFDAYLLLAPYLGHDAPTVRPNSGGWVQVSVRRIIGLSILNQLGLTRFNDTPVLFFNRPQSKNGPLQLDSYSYRLMVSFSPQAYQTALQANSQPILLLVGEQDEAFYAEQFPLLMMANAPQATVKILPNVKHLNLPDAQGTMENIALWVKQGF